MNRRKFLQSMIAIGWSTALPEVSLAAAPKAAIDRLWRAALADPLVFQVASWGTISFGDEVYPETRAALFDLEPVVARNDLLRLADEFSGFDWVMETAWQERDDEQAFDDWRTWLEEASDDDVEFAVGEVNDWLDGCPDERDWEVANRYGDTAQGSALRYFRDSFEFNDRFNIAIVEGDHPGSSYYAAELHMSVDEANQLAVEEGIPIRFEWGE